MSKCIPIILVFSIIFSSIVYYRLSQFSAKRIPAQRLAGWKEIKRRYDVQKSLDGADSFRPIIGIREDERQTGNRVESKNRRKIFPSIDETRKPCVTPNRRYSQVKYFLLFIGYARSGSTLMGSLLDAHPNMIVANEYGLAKKFATFNQSQKTRRYIFHQLFKNSIQEATAKQRSPSFAGLFNYHVHDQWQGKFNCSIQVIGDKRSVQSARSLARSTKWLEELKNIVKVPIKFIHLYRNPYDNIATMVLRHSAKRHAAKNKDFKPYKNLPFLEESIQHYLKWVENVEVLRSIYPDDILDISYSQLVKKPTRILQKVCKFLQIHCSNDYKNSCKRKVFRGETFTRSKIVWTKKAKLLVRNELKEMSPYRNFSFDA